MAYPILFKTNLDFVARYKKLVDEYNGITGTKGRIKYMASGTMSALTTANMKTFKSWCPSAWSNGKVEAHINPYLDKPNYYGADCNNLPKAIVWGLDTSKLDEIDKYTPNGAGVKRNSNGLGDLNADQLFEICTEKSSDLSYIIPGEMVWMKGHIGMYYGKIDGVDYVIDVTISQGGLALNKMSNQRWTKHGKFPFVGEYVVENNFDDYFNALVSVQNGDRGEKVEQAQISLNHANEVLKLGFIPLETDGIYGGKTDALADRVKQLYFIDEIGIGIKTIALLCSIK